MKAKIKDHPWLSEFETLIESKEIAKAKDLLELHKASIAEEDLNYLKGIIYCAKKQFAKALPFLEKAYEINPTDIDTARILSWAISSSKTNDLVANSEALKIIDNVIREREKTLPVTRDLLYDLNVKSNILYRLGRYYEARENIERTSKLFPASDLPKFIQLLYEKGGRESSTQESQKRKSEIVKYIMTIVCAILATVLSTYIIKLYL
jgi:tetratricopeptide (TPR) repeat protein